MPLSIRNNILKIIYRIAPFNVTGDVNIQLTNDSNIEVSCIIPTSHRLKHLRGILESLSRQGVEKNKFEVIIVEDGHSDCAEALSKEFSKRINLSYINLNKPIRLIGRIRNIGLETSRGKYILFLDDDTVIWQKSFLSELINIFQKYSPDIVLPRGKGLRGYVKNYSYLDEYSFATRCCAYQRKTIGEIKGFISFLSAYEDIDLGIRSLILDKKIYRAEELEYYHPPLYFASLKKPLMLGHNLAKLRKKYSLLFWIACFINGIRFLPFLVLPSFRLRQWGKMSLGILVANVYPFLKKEQPYGRT